MNSQNFLMKQIQFFQQYIKIKISLLKKKTRLSPEAYLRKKSNDLWNNLLLLGHNSNPILVAKKGLVYPDSYLCLFDDLIKCMNNLEIAIAVYNRTNKKKISLTSIKILERIYNGEKIADEEITNELKKYL